jgi:hypothetical protein
MSEFRVPDDVLRAEVNGQEVLLNTETGMYHVLNPNGRRILIGLENGWSVDACVDAIVEATDVDRDRAEADARSFLSNLMQRRLLEAID